MNIIEYKTATGDTLKELDAAVNDLLRKNFQPFGNPYFVGSTPGNTDAPVCQAMVKEANVPKPNYVLPQST